MQKALHVSAMVQSGGKVEFASTGLEAGQTVDVVADALNNRIKYRLGRHE